MTELEVLDTDVGRLDTVEFAPDGRVEYDNGHLTAVYPTEAATEKYALAEYEVTPPTDTVDMPDDSVLLSITGGTLVVAVPIDAYGDGT